MVPRSSVEYLRRARDSALTSPVMRSPLRIHTESVFCASAAAPTRSDKPPSNRRAKVLETKADIDDQLRRLRLHRQVNLGELAGSPVSFRADGRGMTRLPSGTDGRVRAKVQLIDPPHTHE